jgi:thiamine biosynthesis lipoprotein ApbE
LHRPSHSQLIKFLLFGVALIAGCERQSHLVEQRILQFGTVIDITLIHDDRAKSEQTLIEIERRLSAYRQSWHAWEDSDLTRFNQALSSPHPVTIPASLLDLITLSRQYYSTVLFKIKSVIQSCAGKIDCRLWVS